MINENFLQEQTDEVRLLYERRNCFVDIENKYNKQLHLITKEELLDYFVEQKPTSLIFLVQQKNLISSYIEWERKRFPTIENQIKDIDTSDLEKCLDRGFIETTFVTRKQLLKALIELQNYPDKFMCLALFEGIKGERYKDLYYFKISDIDENDVVKLHSGRKQKLSRELVIYAHEAVRQDTREGVDRQGRTYSIKYKPDNEHPFKEIIHSKYVAGEYRSDVALTQIFKERMAVVQKLLTSPAMRSQRLIDSGKVDYIKQLANGRTDYYEVILENKDKLIERYGKESSYKKWYLKFKDCFDE